MCVLIFSIMFVWKISHSKKNWSRYLKCASVFTYSTGYSGLILIKLEFFRQVFRKILKYEVSWKLSSEPNFPCGRTDRHDEANSLIFRNFANSVPWSTVLVEKLTVYQLVNKFRAFVVEPLSSFAFPQEPASFYLPDRDESDPQRHVLLQDQPQRFASPTLRYVVSCGQRKGFGCSMATDFNTVF
jgi:hypothetical protein